VINFHGRAHHSRTVALLAERSKHSRRDLAVGSDRSRDVGHGLEVPLITEGQSSKEFVDGIDEWVFRWVSGSRNAAHPQALSVCERVSGDLALSRYRAKGELYQAIRGRNVNILV
jgi:hypothetical protein